MALTVVTSETKSIVDILKHYDEIGIKNVQFKVCRGIAEDSWTLSSKSVNKFLKLYDELNKFLKEEIKKNNLKYLFMILNDNDYFGKIIRRIILRDRSVRRCQSGRNKLAFTANGDVYPCDSFVGREEYKVGNIFSNESLKNPLEEINFSCSNQCSQCWARYICSGDCYYDSMLTTGSICVPDGSFCTLNRRLIDNAIELLGYINSNKPEVLEEIERFLRIREKIFA